MWMAILQPSPVIDAAGELTANSSNNLGRIRVTATVAADATYRGATTGHTLDIILIPANLRFTAMPPATLELNDTYTFMAATAGNTAITWSVTDTDDNATALATIGAMTGVLTASGVGRVKVTAIVAADATYGGDSISHELEITLRASGLAFTETPPPALDVDATHDFVATSDSGGAITYSVTDVDDTATALAMIDGNGLLTALGGGMVKVTATVEADDTYSAATLSHTLTINRLSADLRISTPNTNIPQSGGDVILTASTDSTGPITWSVSDTSIATISGSDRTATLTPVATGDVTITAEIAQTVTHETGSTTIDITVNNLLDTNLRFTNATLPATLDANGVPYTFTTASDNSGATIIWRVANADDSNTSLAALTDNSDGTATLAPNAAGTIKVTATVVADDTYSGDIIVHTLTITRLPANLTFTAAPERLRAGSDQTAQFSVTRDGDGALTWNIVEESPAAAISGTGLVTATATAETITVQVVVAETDTHTGETLTVELQIADFVDFDGDGLIDIHDLTMLHNMRHNLAGTSYKDSGSAGGVTTGCPDNTPDNGVANENCVGYELMGNLDFDRNGNGYTWNRATLAVDSGDTESTYFADGWEPIGDGSNPFTAIFEGNGFVIRNLAVRLDQSFIGLFGELTGTIRNLGLEQALADYTGDDNPETYIGTLVGRMMTGGSIIASYASGLADGGAGDRDHVGGLVGHNVGGAITASYANVTARGGAGGLNKVGGLVGENSGGGTITASYATGTADGGMGHDDFVGGLAGHNEGGTITASYASGDVDGGNGDGDIVGALVGLQDSGGTITASYGFGVKERDEQAGIDSEPTTNTATRAAALTAGTAGANTNAGVEWDQDTSGTLGAWDFGDANQPPALRYSDYDGTGSDNDIDYCADFAVANIQCGTLIPGQRATTTPQFGIETGDIQFAQGDTAASVTANILLPATLVVDGASLDLTWSVHHDPAADPVTINSDGDTLLVDADRRTSTRTVILRATTRGDGVTTTVNDYRLRIIEGSDGLQNPGLRFTETVDTLVLMGSHDFAATSDSSGALTYSVTDMDGNATTLATVSASTVTASSSDSSGTVRVTATVAADDTYRGATIAHILGIRRLANLAFAETVDTLEVNSSHTFTTTSLSSAAVTWSVTNTDDTATDRATIDPNSGELTARQGGTVKVTATLAQDDTFAGAAISHMVEITRLATTLTLTSVPDMDTLVVMDNHTFAASDPSSSGRAITWSVTDTGDAATTLASIGSATGLLTTQGAGMVKVTAAVEEDDIYAAGSGSHIITITRLASDLAFDSTVDTLEVDASHTFTTSTESTGALTWSVTDTDLATIDSDSGLFTARQAGTVEVIATVADDSVYSGSSIRHPVTITRLPANLRFTASPVRLLTSHTTRFAVARGGDGVIAWSIAAGPATINPNTGELTTNTNTGVVTVQAVVAQTPTHFSDTITTTLVVTDEVDADSDGLIEIYDLTMLHNMRHNLSGTSYKDSASASGVTAGCPADTCKGYELVSDLDFDKDGDGRTWSGDSTNGYTLDGDDSQAPYFVTANGGWEPIGTDFRSRFRATFEGNGFMIRNLAIRRLNQLGGSSVALFGATSGTLRNIGLEQVLADNSAGGNPWVAPLVGLTTGDIIASYASGTADGGSSGSSTVGGLVGYQTNGTITASYAHVRAHGRSVTRGDVGGLVGRQDGGTITASYATGAVEGGDGNDSVGGLVGNQTGGGAITASYATGEASGGGGSDSVGSLVGLSNGSITASYGFGDVTIIVGSENTRGSHPNNSVTRAAALTAGTAAMDNTHAGDEWNQASSGTLGAWDFGNANQPPALLYNDYDGTPATNDIDHCTLFAAANTPCGGLIPGQRTATTPQFGSGADDIQLAAGDTVNRVTANVTLPATLTIDSTDHNLVWSVQDPDDSNPVTIDSGTTLLVDTDSRATTRWIILSVATTAASSTTLNEYRLRIIQVPSLSFDVEVVSSLPVRSMHDFSASTNSSAPITYRVSDEALATIDASGQLTAIGAGSVEVTAIVAESDAYSSATLSHTVELTRLDSNLAFIATVDTLEAEAAHNFAATSDNTSATIRYSVTDTRDVATDLATISPSGVLTAHGVGRVKVTASVAQDSVYNSDTQSHTLAITLSPANLRLTASPLRLLTSHTTQFTAARNGSGAITWSIVEGDAVATIDSTNGRVTATATTETVTVQAAVPETATHSGETVTATLEVTDQADYDGDGLIEIYDLTMLHNIRHNLAGTSYKNSNGAPGVTTGCPDATSGNGVDNEDCIGYELASDLSFDKDGDGRTWSSSDLTLDAGDSQAPYFNTANGGWPPIGGRSNPFTATLEGNGFMIRSLAIRRNQQDIGLLGGATGTIRNLGLEDALADFTGRGGTNLAVAPLVGYMAGGTIIASHVSGVAHGGVRNEYVGGLVGWQTNGAIIASYAAVRVDNSEGGAGDFVGGLVGYKQGGSIAASYASGDVILGASDSGTAGGLVGLQSGGTTTASYATGNVDGGSGNLKIAGKLIGEGSASASYGFGATMGGTHASAGDGSPPAGVTGLTATNAGSVWDAAASNTLDAWDFGDSNQPPALLYNDYDGTGGANDIDYCALFAAANTPCGTLIPGQRTATTPQLGSGRGDIQLAAGDTANSITTSVLLPASITVGGTTLNLMWSVQDPDDTNPVTIDSGTTLLVDTDSRATTRWIILSVATTAAPATTLNEYRLRIIQGSGGLQNPGLRLTDTTNTLPVRGMYNFAAASAAGTTITWSVSDAALAIIDISSGQLTATSAGSLQVIATVAATETYRGATARHTLTITHLPANLGITGTPPATLDVNATHTFTASTEGNTGIVWSVTNTDDSPTDRASINPATGVFTALKGGGAVKVTATVAEDGVYAAATDSHTVTLNRLPSDLAFTSRVNELAINESHTFTVSTESTGALTWAVTDTRDRPTTLASIDRTTGELTALRGGPVKVTARVQRDDTYVAGSLSHTVTLNRLPSDLAFTSTTDTLEVNSTYDFDATASNSGRITWLVTVGGRSTSLASINHETGVLTAHGGGTVRVSATVPQDDTYASGGIFREVTLERLPANLTLDTFGTNIPLSGDDLTLTATTDSPATITWRGDDDSIATITDNGDSTATLMPVAVGTVTVTAEVAQTGTHAGDTQTIDITINALQSPSLSFTTTVDTLPARGTHNFVATSASSGMITYSVSDTALATISDSGQLTANRAGTVEVIATVAANGPHSTATIAHPLEITRLPSDLAIGSTVDELAVNDSHTFTASKSNSGAVTWSVTNTDDTSTDRATIDPNSGELTARKGGDMVKVTATVAADDVYAESSVSHTVTLNRLDSNLALDGTPPATLLTSETYGFEATSDAATITWSVSDTAIATINMNSGLLTPRRAGTVQVTATVTEDSTYNGATVSHTLAINRAPANLRFTASPPRLLTSHSTRFKVARDGNGAITWSIVESDAAASIGTNGLVTAAATTETVTVQAMVTETPTHLSDTLSATLEVTDQADYDNDGLIEIYDLTMLHNIRHNPAGTSYKNSNSATGVTTGCPDATPGNGVDNEDCIGYELTSDLNFDADGDGRTWNGLTLDGGDRQPPYFNTADGGWVPIGSFSAIFEGNGHVIHNLAIRRNDHNPAGLFGVSTGTIRNLGLKQALVYGIGNIARRGVLVGQMNGGTITASYATGRVASGGTTGGLVGLQQQGTIIASYADVTVDGNGSAGEHGGLVGSQGGSSAIIASYATGAVNGGNDRLDRVGGLVSRQVGDSTITASYATGAVRVGSRENFVGSLVGQQINRASINTSYGFGGITGETRNTLGAHPTITSAAALTLVNTDNTATAAVVEWNDADLRTLSAWDFGTTDQPPALLYNDYDGDGMGIDYCALFAAANTPCGSRIPGQRTATTPQFGSGADDIQLAAGDTVNRVTTNVTLPATLTIDSTAHNLVWSVQDPDGSNPVTIDGGTTLRVDTSRRATTRWIVLSVATTAAPSTILNEYRLRIVQPTTLTFTDTVDTLEVEGTHTFVATSNPSAVISWSVTNPDGTLTNRAAISSDGLLTARAGGMVRVVASVAATSTHNGATASHTVNITRFPTNLVLTDSPERLRVGSDQTARFSATRDGDGAITWSIVEEAPAAMISGSDDENSGLVTAGNTEETITVQVIVAATPTHEGATLTAALKIADFVDFDGNGLIEIDSLTMLHNMRHDLAGSSYKDSDSAMGSTTGCPDATPENDVTSEDCIGYELVSDLEL